MEGLLSSKVSIEVCNDLLRDLGWKWDNQRLQNWLYRVGIATRGKPFQTYEEIPEEVYVSLAKFLDLRLRCDRLLALLKWDWEHPKVKSFEFKHRCTATLPLRGYQELYRTLDEAWLNYSGGF